MPREHDPFEDQRPDQPINPKTIEAIKDINAGLPPLVDSKRTAPESVKDRIAEARKSIQNSDKWPSDPYNQDSTQQ